MTKKTFSEQIADETRQINKGFERIIRAAAIGCFRNIIFQSPVDSGRFRGNWFASGAAASSKVTEGTDEAGNKTADNAAELVLHLRDWNIFQLTNNLPYAEVIEFGGYGSTEANTGKTVAGYSRQAPSGVVRVALANTAKNLAKAKIDLGKAQ